jgi:hypothetical protein
MAAAAILTALTVGCGSDEPLTRDQVRSVCERFYDNICRTWADCMGKDQAWIDQCFFEHADCSTGLEADACLQNQGAAFDRCADTYEDGLCEGACGDSNDFCYVYCPYYCPTDS